MSRPMPAEFANQSTYSIVDESETNRVTPLPASLKCNMKDMLTGNNHIAARLCLAGLQSASEPEDIGKLVLGAMISMSGTTLTAAKVVSVYDSKLLDPLRKWANFCVYGIIPDPLGPDDAVYANTQSGDPAIPMPSDCMPEWLQEVEVSDEHFRFAWSVSDIELAGYIGVLGYVVSKEPTPENLPSFNQKRRGAVLAGLTSGELEIFVNDSPYLSLETVQKVHRAFNTLAGDRAVVMTAILASETKFTQGPARIFYSIFNLSKGASLNPLGLISRFAKANTHLYAEFPEFHTEYHAAAEAMRRFRDVNHQHRLFLKVIYGSSYVPVDRNDIDRLLGLATFVLSIHEPTLSNYQGGSISAATRNKIIRILNIETTAAEEVAEAGPSNTHATQ